MRKNLIPLYFVIVAVVAGLVYFTWVYQEDVQQTTPKIKLSRFSTVADLAKATIDSVATELQAENQFWIGIEPQKKAHMKFAEELLQVLKSQNKIKQVYIDEQLGFENEELAAYQKMFPDFKIVLVRDNWPLLADQYRNRTMDYSAVITAAIYSTSMLPQNPIDKIKKDVPDFNPTTFSSGHFAINTEDEKNNIFPCFTEDKTGTNKWACTVIGKARAQRRKMQGLPDEVDKKLIGTMDSTGSKDFMLLFTELR